MSSADRQKRWRDRQREGVVVPVCGCGKRAQGKHAPLCSRCWTSQTVEGRAERAARVKRSKQRKRDGL